MSKNFEIIKKKYFIAAVIASVVLGVCCGVGITCVLAVVFKRCAVNFFWALYIPVAIALAAAFAWLFYVILHPTDKRMAKKLDKDYALNQKVQTMVEYRGASDAMAVLQREQADEVLGGVVSKRVDLKWLAKFAFIPVLAAAMLFTGIFVPAVKSSDNPTFVPTDSQRTALVKLISDVEKSSLGEDIKTPVTEVLNGLLDTLDSTNQQSVMKIAVISAVKIIDGLVSAANSYINVSSALKEDDGLSALADAVVNSVLYYRENGAQITTFDAVKAKENAADEAIEKALTVWRHKLLIAICDGDGDPQPKPVAEAAGIIKEYAEKLSEKLALTKYAQEEESSDGLYLALDAFAKQLAVRSETTAGINVAMTYYSQAEADCNDFTASCSKEVAVQSYRCMMDEFIRNSLARIFDINRNEFGNLDSITTPPSSGSDDDPITLPGAEGNKDFIYGSNDLILDADTGEQVEYGKVLQKYFDDMTYYIQEGHCGEEVALYIRQYFQLLYAPLE